MSKDFVEQTEACTKATARSFSEYIREAVREKNQRQTADRIKFFVPKFSAEAEAVNEEFDATTGDSLTKRDSHETC